MKKPFGYAIAFAVQYTAMVFVHCNIAYMISLAFGMSIIKNIRSNIYSINKNVKSKEKIFKKISNFIDFHSILEQLRNMWMFIMLKILSKWFSFHFEHSGTVGEFSNIYQPIIMALFLWCILTICGTMLLLQYGIVEFIVIKSILLYFLVYHFVDIICRMKTIQFWY